MSAGHTHVRINHGWLAAVEKKVLIWMARRLPGWINADHQPTLTTRRDRHVPIHEERHASEHPFLSDREVAGQ